MGDEDDRTYAEGLILYSYLNIQIYSSVRRRVLLRNQFRSLFPPGSEVSNLIGQESVLRTENFMWSEGNKDVAGTTSPLPPNRGRCVR